MSDPYRKVGRGGAGNYYSPQQVKEAEKKQAAADVETQKTVTNAASVGGSANDGHHQYARAGRGGAGNLVDASVMASAERDGEVEAGNKTLEAHGTSAVRGAGPGAYSGRGGAGNWTSGGGGRTAADAVSAGEARQREEMERKVLADVDAGLARPDKAYATPGSDSKSQEL